MPVNLLRIGCSFRAVLHPNWQLTNRQPCFKAVKCSSRWMSVSFPKEDTWFNHIKLGTLGKERELICCARRINSNRSFCAGTVALNCWNCKEPLEKTPAFFCLSCKVVQPSDEGTSYFKIMNCDCTFALDTQKLQKRYLQLQRSLHPDNFSQRSVREREYSEHQSALVNKAYKTLLKPLSRGLYMLELKGVTIEDGTDSGTDSEFLMELMEINEALDEAQTPEEASKIGQNTKEKLSDLTAEIDAALRKGELQAAKALLAQMKYFANIEEKVKKKLSEFM
ncbi:iron-sulfur cluster co-chaperone protein HscB [Aulostomus maculatus]